MHSNACSCNSSTPSFQTLLGHGQTEICTYCILQRMFRYPLSPFILLYIILLPIPSIETTTVSENTHRQHPGPSPPQGSGYSRLIAWITSSCSSVNPALFQPSRARRAKSSKCPTRRKELHTRQVIAQGSNNVSPIHSLENQKWVLEKVEKSWWETSNNIKYPMRSCLAWKKNGSLGSIGGNFPENPTKGLNMQEWLQKRLPLQVY